MRAKVYGKRLGQTAFDAVITDVAAGHYSDLQLAAFVTACAGDHLDLALFHTASGLDITARLQLDADRPEFTVALSAEGPLPSSFVFPQPFTGEKGADCAAEAKLAFKAPSSITARVQECHLLIGHLLCDVVEKAYATA